MLWFLKCFISCCDVSLHCCCVLTFGVELWFHNVGGQTADLWPSLSPEVFPTFPVWVWWKNIKQQLMMSNSRKLRSREKTYSRTRLWTRQRFLSAPVGDTEGRRRRESVCAASHRSFSSVRNIWGGGNTTSRMGDENSLCIFTPLAVSNNMNNLHFQ